MDRVGEKYGKLTILRYLDTTWSDRYICRCDCGNTKIESISNLRRKKRTKFDCGQCPKEDKDYQKLFMRYVIKTESCWLWNKALDRDGYGCIMIDKLRLKAHRAAYLLFVGEIKDNQYVCHRCDNPQCVNPQHLFLGTHLDNERDKDLKGRRPVSLSGQTSMLTSRDISYIRTTFDKLPGSKLERYRKIASDLNCNVRIVERVVKKESFRENPFSFLSKLKRRS